MELRTGLLSLLHRTINKTKSTYMPAWEQQPYRRHHWAVLFYSLQNYRNRRPSCTVTSWMYGLVFYFLDQLVLRGKRSLLINVVSCLFAALRCIPADLQKSSYHQFIMFFQDFCPSNQFILLFLLSTAQRYQQNAFWKKLQKAFFMCIFDLSL